MEGENMRTKLVIDGNAVYEIDEECVERKKREGNEKKCYEDCEQQFLMETKEEKISTESF